MKNYGSNEQSKTKEEDNNYRYSPLDRKKYSPNSKPQENRLTEY